MAQHGMAQCGTVHAAVHPQCLPTSFHFPGCLCVCQCVCPAEGCLVVTGAGASFRSRFCSCVFVYMSVGCVSSVLSSTAVKDL